MSSTATRALRILFLAIGVIRFLISTLIFVPAPPQSHSANFHVPNDIWSQLNCRYDGEHQQQAAGDLFSSRFVRIRLSKMRRFTYRGGPENRMRDFQPPIVNHHALLFGACGELFEINAL